MPTTARQVMTGLSLATLLWGVAAAQTAPQMLDQGPQWTDVERADFYTRDQGSRLMPFAWLQALKQPDGQPFLADLLARYGYLPNALAKTGLPIGFTLSGPTGAQVVGMTCAACHTRQMTVKGQAYRVDGGPAFADFQGLVGDLDTAVGAVLKDDAAFAAFVAAVPSSADMPPVQRVDVEAWYARYHALMSVALPKASPWGRGRLDALGMIFNRLTGLDLGPPESGGIIAENIRPADAPVRYPFLWNAPIQDHTQWPGIAGNGDDMLAISRNLGEVYGVFGEFAPTSAPFPSVLNIDYLRGNSASFDGLTQAESLVKRIGPPQWPWPVDQALVAQGAAIFARHTADGGCVDCHGIRPGLPRLSLRPTWDTPIKDVGTDNREYQVLQWTAKTGAMVGAFVPTAGVPLRPTEGSGQILKTAVLGSIIQHQVEALAPFSAAFRALASGQIRLANTGLAALPPLPRQLQTLADAFTGPPPLGPDEPPFRYESRVMQGIWAAAPYLHNGSVPSLAELLKPPAERVTSFRIGPAYDLETVGLAVDQGADSTLLQTTSCADRSSGNSNCGHDYGTALPPDEKRALLEYLKTL